MVARGSALQAAMLSPLYKVRNFGIKDYSQYAIALEWVPPGSKMTKDFVAFPIRSPMNLTKMVTFTRQETFEVRAVTIVFYW